MIPKVMFEKTTSPFNASFILFIAALCLVAAACQNIMVDTEILDAPSITPASGAYGETQTVFISHTDPLAVIRYTTDGSEPNETSQDYAGPFQAVFGSTTVRALAFKAGLKNSAIATRSIRVVWKKISNSKPWGTLSNSFSRQIQAVEAGGSKIIVYGPTFSDITFISTPFYLLFDIATGNWTLIESSDEFWDEFRMDTCLIQHGDDRLHVGGRNLEGNTLFPVARRYNGTSWGDAGFITSRYGLATVSDGTNAYAIGGMDDSPTIFKTLEMYNGQTGTVAWIPKADLPGPRVFTSAVLLSGHIYVFGGYTDILDGLASNKVKTILDYSIGTNTWETLSTTMPRSDSYNSVVTWYDSSRDRTLALVFGNHIMDGATEDPQVGEALFFDPQEGSVRIGNSMPQIEGDEARKSAAVNLGGRIFLVCTSGSVWEYLPGLD